MPKHRQDKAEKAFGVLGGVEEDTSLESVADAMYGASAPELDTGRVVAKPISLMDIWADPTQPRRVVPQGVRKDWDGDPAKVDNLINEWQARVTKSLDRGDRYLAGPILRGEDFQDLDREQQSPMVRGYIDLVELATSIRDKGLNLPITVSKEGGIYRLHTGERRWLAHHLLQMTVKGHEKITAIVRTADVWSQIEENTQREQMNAISLARSLAKLKMAMWADEMTFESYAHMVQAGGGDRHFFAQAAELSIRQGMAETVRNTLNIANRGMISRYNKLLTLPDEVWMQADEENWSEGKIRQWFDAQKPQAQRSEPNARLPTGNLRDEQLLPIGNNSPQNAPQADYSAEESKPPPRTTYGERMGLYDDEKKVNDPPAPRQKGPTITEYSSLKEWRESGYKHCPKPSELKGGQTWDENDEAYVVSMLIQSDIEMRVLQETNAAMGLDKTKPLATGETLSVLLALQRAARETNNKLAEGVIATLATRSMRNVENIVEDAGGDLEAVEHQLTQEHDELVALIVMMDTVVLKYMTALMAKAREVANAD